MVVVVGRRRGGNFSLSLDRKGGFEFEQSLRHRVVEPNQDKAQRHGNLSLRNFAVFTGLDAVTFSLVVMLTSANASRK